MKYQLLIKAPQGKKFKPFNGLFVGSRKETRETFLWWKEWERRTGYTYRVVKVLG